MLQHLSECMLQHYGPYTCTTTLSQRCTHLVLHHHLQLPLLHHITLLSYGPFFCCTTTFSCCCTTHHAPFVQPLLLLHHHPLLLLHYTSRSFRTAPASLAPPPSPAVAPRIMLLSYGPCFSCTTSHAPFIGPLLLQLCIMLLSSSPCFCCTTTLSHCCTTSRSFHRSPAAVALCIMLLLYGPFFCCTTTLSCCCTMHHASFVQPLLPLTNTIFLKHYLSSIYRHS